MTKKIYKISLVYDERFEDLVTKLINSNSDLLKTLNRIEYNIKQLRKELKIDD